MEYIIVHYDDVYKSESKKLKVLQLWDINLLTDLSPSAHRHSFHQ